MSRNRRSQWTALFGVLIALECAAACAASSHNVAELHRYWPKYPRPEALWTVPFTGDHELGMVFETAAGLAATALEQGRTNWVLLEDLSGSSAYAKWTQMMIARTRPRVEGPISVWQAVGKLREAGIVRGYILYRYDTNPRPMHGPGIVDESANVATSLAGILGGVAVSERLRPDAEKLGLPMLLDARDRTETWCLAQHAQEFGSRAVALADPKSRVARHMAVAMNAFVASGPGETYEAALARCEPDCPVIGWGCGDEQGQTLPSSQWGLFQTATNWCHNLPAYSTEEPSTMGVRVPERCRRSWRDIQWETGVHYVAFLMSDGDNVQWLMGNFAGGSEGRWYYESPARGKFPFGWTLCYADLAQVCPYTLGDLFSRATPQDDFVLYGGGYYYPDRFGEKREDDLLALHARRMGAYMRFGGLRTIAFNAIDWDGPKALRAYNTFAREAPGLDGIFTVQYYPYSAGEGRILWAGADGRHTPVISCRFTIWANQGRPCDATPAAVAARLSALPKGRGVWTEDCFSFVMPHSWSRFKDTHGAPSLTAEEEGVDQGKDAPDTARGLLPVQWCVDRLGSDVRVVTPHELALLVRLHLRTREALAQYIAELKPRAAVGHSARPRELLRQAESRLPDVGDADNSGRRTFRLLQRVDQMLTDTPAPPAEYRLRVGAWHRDAG